MSAEGMTESIFDARVDAWVADAVRDEAHSFAQVLRELPGVYPTAVLAALDRAVAKGAVRPDHADRLRREASDGEDKSPCRRSHLPLPHPIDYEWRFSPTTSRELLDLANSLSRPQDEIFLFGTPSVAFEAMSHPMDRAVAFLGPDNAVTKRLVALNVAMDSLLKIALCTDVLPRDVAQVIIIDPPWYLDFVRPMIMSAAAACREGGYILASLPPAGARAKAALDRARLFQLADRLGLELHKEFPLSVEYDTPFFEANALKAAGIAALRAWRRGDLVIFRKRVPQATLQPRAAQRPTRWREVQVGQMRLFVGAAARTGSCGLVSLIAGDVLPTVSRRDERRRAALIWTSGNRIFGSDDTELTITAALQAAGGTHGTTSAQPQLYGTIAEQEEVERVAAALTLIAAQEADEERAMRPVGDGRGGISWTSAPVSSSSGSLQKVLG